MSHLKMTLAISLELKFQAVLRLTYFSCILGYCPYSSIVIYPNLTIFLLILLVRYSLHHC